MNKVVLTGGPCGGKTTLLPDIEKRYGADNICILDESVQPLFSNEFNKIKIDGRALTTKEFQTFIFITQYLKEYQAETLYRDNPNGLIICDRGLLDGKAHMDPLLFEAILAKFAKSENEILRTYAKVIHLTSMCYHDIDFFNTNRPYAKDTGFEVDVTLKEVWGKHPGQIIVPTTDDFEDKKLMVFNILDHLQENESKHLSDYYDEQDMQMMKEHLNELFDYYASHTDRFDQGKIKTLRKEYERQKLL